MRYAVLSDVHANIEALRAVVDDLETRNIDKVLCCGDSVGYYANPNECIELLRQLGTQSILGNHDAAVCGQKSDLSSFWDVARRAIRWTKRVIREDNLKWLDEAPITMKIDDLILFHGCLHLDTNPDELHLYRYDDIEKSLATLKGHSGTSIGFFGHLHKQISCWSDGDQLIISRQKELHLEPGKRYLINPGSVGRSRDDDKLASYLIYDHEEGVVTFYTVPFDRSACLGKADSAGLLAPPLPGRIKYKISSIQKRVLRWIHD